ncbi:hypothetical protein PILCRDRAFT_824829 [Piloderma croceum F 1598]|uniref:Uncharacterized protein n=1 Tax=Piloderma croceum (strain F 1598) TaxID=765440 RepID=A0A0C3AVU6_PILCF|nr:hypothetical protein PILCRDRAFT_824829 [Piloderma croceum F 1598]
MTMVDGSNSRRMTEIRIFRRAGADKSESEENACENEPMKIFWMENACHRVT